MQKIVINTCFGGFSLSPLAVKELAKRKGKECYFFIHELKNGKFVNTSATIEQATEAFSFTAYSVPDPEAYNLDERDADGLYKSANERADKISLATRPDDRSDKDLIEVVEMLGEKANGSHAELKIVEIPDDVKWQIEEYDGSEHIAEQHRTWY